jgi:hypothetical protein
MGINACILQWIDELAADAAFQGLSSVLELGPQDFFFGSELLLEIARRRTSEEAAHEIVDCIFGVQPPFAKRQAAFYSTFGLSEYASTDPYDNRADFRLDLNVADRAPKQVDVVVDLGTTEHVFNAANVFVFTHNSLKVGGISIKVLPTYGDNTHGFYNIHPTVYFDIARVNFYDIVDFRYVHNMLARSVAEGPRTLITAAEMIHGLRSFAGCATLQERISSSFLESLRRSQLEGRMGQAHSTVDYCFVAIRKTVDRPFQYPGQGVYITEFGL